MPNSKTDVKSRKHSLESDKKLVKQAQIKAVNAAIGLKNGNPPREGLGLLSHMAGLFGQRLYFYNKTKQYTDKLKIDEQKCNGCGGCVKICPMKNLSISSNLARSKGRCTMCYRCINTCRKQAITLLGKDITEQAAIEKYLE